MTKQDLDCPDVACGFVDDRGFGSAQRLGAVLIRSQTDGRNPLINKPSVLARTQVAIRINSAWKYEVLDVTSSELQPGKQTGTCVRSDLKLNRATCLALGDCRSRSD